MLKQVIDSVSYLHVDCEFYYWINFVCLDNKCGCLSRYLKWGCSLLGFPNNRKMLVSSPTPCKISVSAWGCTLCTIGAATGIIQFRPCEIAPRHQSRYPVLFILPWVPDIEVEEGRALCQNWDASTSRNINPKNTKIQNGPLRLKKGRLSATLTQELGIKYNKDESLEDALAKKWWLTLLTHSLSDNFNWRDASASEKYNNPKNTRRDIETGGLSAALTQELGIKLPNPGHILHVRTRFDLLGYIENTQMCLQIFWTFQIFTELSQTNWQRILFRFVDLGKRMLSDQAGCPLVSRTKPNFHCRGPRGGGGGTGYWDRLASVLP